MINAQGPSQQGKKKKKRKGKISQLLEYGAVYALLFLARCIPLTMVHGMTTIFSFIGTIMLITCLTGCAHVEYAADLQERTGNLTADIEDKILSLDPGSVTEKDVTELLSRGSAPRIINLNGSIPIISMASFSKFLISMGYPEESVRSPQGAYSYSSYKDSAALAGMIAWYYEREGMMPMIIGHSQGGMLVIKVLHEFAGAFNEKIALWNPYTDKPEDRYTFIGPYDGEEHPIVGLRVGFASAVATGKLMRFMLGQWNMLSRLREIPDTVEEFTGFHIKNDLISGEFLFPGQTDRYHPLGSAQVRNVMLPSYYSHITIPLTEDLAQNPETREWINSYMPRSEHPLMDPELRGDSDNILFAADIWYSIKKHWCIELQQHILAQKKMQLGS